MKFMKNGSFGKIIFHIKCLILGFAPMLVEGIFQTQDLQNHIQLNESQSILGNLMPFLDRPEDLSLFEELPDSLRNKEKILQRLTRNFPTGTEAIQLLKFIETKLDSLLLKNDNNKRPGPSLWCLRDCCRYKIKLMRLMGKSYD
eukprot:UN01121